MIINYLKNQRDRSNSQSYDKLTLDLLKSLDSRTIDAVKDGSIVLLSKEVDKKYLETYQKVASYIDSNSVVLEMKRLRKGCMCITYQLNSDIFIYKLYGLGKEVYLVSSSEFDKLKDNIKISR